MQLTKTSLEMAAPVPSIWAPLTTMPSDRSSTTPA